LIVLFNLRKKRSGPLPQMAKKIVKVLSGLWGFYNPPMQPGQEFAFHGDMVRQFLKVMLVQRHPLLWDDNQHLSPSILSIKSVCQHQHCFNLLCPLHLYFIFNGK